MTRCDRCLFTNTGHWLTLSSLLVSENQWHQFVNSGINWKLHALWLAKKPLALSQHKAHFRGALDAGDKTDTSMRRNRLSTNILGII